MTCVHAGESRAGSPAFTRSRSSGFARPSSWFLYGLTRQILIQAESLSSFADLVQTEQVDGFYKVTKREISAAAGSQAGQESWKRTRLAREVVRKINTQYKARTQNRGIVIHGPVNTDLRLLLDAVQELLFQELAVPRAPRLHTLFKRRSTYHPFLNSIDPFFLKAAAQYLTTWEQQVWDDLNGLLWSMKPSIWEDQGVFYRWPKGVPASLRGRERAEGTEERTGGPSAGPVCPDRLYRDFYLVFHLYLSAYFRMLEENFLPAVLFCEDIDTYHPQSLEMLSDLLKDFYQIQSFIPVFTSRTPKLPIDLGGRALKVVAMRPLSSNEMARIANRTFRGCKPPEEVLFSFYDFPAAHWIHIRTTNPIESTFSTVRLRTVRTKGCGSRIATLTMVFKLVMEAQKTRRRLTGSSIIPMVLSGRKFVDGVL